MNRIVGLVRGTIKKGCRKNQRNAVFLRRQSLEGMMTDYFKAVENQ